MCGWLPSFTAGGIFSGSGCWSASWSCRLSWSRCSAGSGSSMTGSCRGSAHRPEEEPCSSGTKWSSPACYMCCSWASFAGRPKIVQMLANPLTIFHYNNADHAANHLLNCTNWAYLAFWNCNLNAILTDDDFSTCGKCFNGLWRPACVMQIHFSLDKTEIMLFRDISGTSTFATGVFLSVPIYKKLDISTK